MDKLLLHEPPKLPIVGAVALIAPLAMTIAGRAGISAFLMTLMVANGANARAFSPFVPAGIIDPTIDGGPIAG